MYPSSYLKKPLSEILSHIGMEVSEFNDICDQFTNKEIFETDSKGTLIKEDNGRPRKRTNLNA